MSTYLHRDMAFFSVTKTQHFHSFSRTYKTTRLMISCLTCAPAALWSWLGGTCPNGCILCGPLPPGWTGQRCWFLNKLCFIMYNVLNNCTCEESLRWLVWLVVLFIQNMSKINTVLTSAIKSCRSAWVGKHPREYMMVPVSLENKHHIRPHYLTARKDCVRQCWSPWEMHWGMFCSPSATRAHCVKVVSNHSYISALHHCLLTSFKYLKKHYRTRWVFSS